MIIILEFFQVLGVKFILHNDEKFNSKVLSNEYHTKNKIALNAPENNCIPS